MIDLPPVSLDAFTEKMNQAQAIPASPEKDCKICKKSFTTVNSLQSHLNSRKHKENEEKYKDRIEADMSVNDSTDDVMEEKPTPVNFKQMLKQAETEGQVQEIINQKLSLPVLTPTQCLFCSKTSRSFSDNLLHMSKSHSFFIPIYLDAEQVFEFASEKISRANLCLYCDKQFYSLQDTQKHMKDTFHGKINDKDVEDYHVDEDEWEDTEDVEDIDMNNGNDNVQVIDGMQYDENNYLVLPSGLKLGHRMYNRIYKQRLTHAIVPHSTTSRGMRRMIGYHQQYEDMTLKKKQMIKMNRDIAEFKFKVGMRANNQKHYRLQNPI
jgi:pre-60S factor REI1